MNPRITRRQFTLGVAAGASAAALGPLPALAGGRPFFDQTTLWDASVDPLANYHVHGLTVLKDAPSDHPTAALDRTKGEVILAMTEGRYETCDAGPRDLLLRRSLDGGDTWEDTRTVVPSVDGQSWGNPTLLADRHTGEVFLFYALSVRLPENTSCSGDSADLFVISSRDKGITWSAPRNLSELFAGFAYDWALHSPGPGHGIQLDNGRLLLNVAHRRVIVGNTVTQRFYGVAGIYSDDHGRTWQACGEVPVSVDYPINEARVVQRDDGTVLINGRNGAGGTGSRIVAVSADRGQTWSAPKMDGATGVFNSVDASLVRYSGGPGSRERNRMLFSRPDSPTRFTMTVSVSYDEGYSLRYSRVINPGRGFYSDLARLSDGTILLLYGCDGDLASAPLRVNLARFNLAWLTNGRDATTLSESVYKLARNAHGQTVVAEGTSRAGARLVLDGDALEIPFTVARSGAYEVALRYYRPADGGLLGVTVDGAALHNYVVDTTAEKSEGYDYVTLGTKWLREGRHHVRFELAGPGRGGGSAISVDTLSLIRCSAPRDNPDEITIDNAGLGYTVVAGTWAAGTGVAGYYGSNYSSHAAGTGANVVRWQPAIPADADYEVRVSYTAASNRATNAPFTVTHAGGTTVVPVNQQVAGVPDPRSGTWVSLGVFPFAAGLAGTVALSDQADGVVIADAVRFLRR